MCSLCSDYVDTCRECPPLYVKENGYIVYPSYYLTLTDEKFCEHLTRKYGTSNIDLAHHVSIYHDEDTNEDITSCECLDEGWWPKEEILICITTLNS